MKIGIQTYGSRGDINPWIALGQGLAQDGHQVILYFTNYTGGDFSQYSRNGLEVVSTRTLDPSNDCYDRIRSRKIYDLDIHELTDYMVEDVFDQFEKEMILAGELLCSQCDILINNPNLYHTTCIAEKRGIPRINILVECQFSPNNRVSTYGDDVINDYFLDRVNTFRTLLGLQLIKNVRKEIFNSKFLNLLAYSRLFSKDEESWGAMYTLCGYLDLDRPTALQRSKELELFLLEGEAPVFFSMGSLAFFEGKQFDILDIFFEAIELSGCRAIIQADWGKINRHPPNKNNILAINYVDHLEILPQCAAMVHHGGAGTSHTSLLSACPSVVIAYAWDQFYWGKELSRLGVSPGTIKRRYLDAVQLAGYIKTIISDPEYKENSLQAKRGMKRERGVKRACKIISEACIEILEDQCV